MLDYLVDLRQAPSRRLHLALTFDAPHDDPVLALAVWTPGSYLVREFQRYLGPITAHTDDGTPYPVDAVDKASWRVRAPAGARVHVRWDAYCNELTVRTPHADPTHAFFTGSNLLLTLRDVDLPARLRFTTPETWTVFCPLHRQADAWHAPDRDTLLDTPFEAGRHRVIHFETLGVPHRLIFWGEPLGAFDWDRLVRDTDALIREHARLFGGELPYTNYDFVFHVTSHARGGLEHLNSTVLATPWRYFETDEGYREMLGLVSHEHFHTWNVKRIRPSGLVPFRYDRENLTTGLWVSEGFTSYYDDLHCLRSGVISEPHWLEALGRALTRYEQTPGRHRQSVADASHDAWFRLYRADDDTPFRTVSYYLKGSVVALALDLTLRNATEHRRSLDDVLRALWNDWKSTGHGFDEHAMAERIREATGVDVDEQLAAWVDGTDDPPLDALLATVGLQVERERDAESAFGVRFLVDGRVEARHVEPGSAADRAGVQPGDELIALHGRRVTAAGWKEQLERSRATLPVPVVVFRRDELHTLAIHEDSPRYERLTVAVSSDDTPQTRERRRAWLGPGPATP